MVAMYNVFGRQVGSHWLSMATLGALFAGSAWAMRGGDKKQNSPPINASSKDEENFIQEFLQSVEQEEQKNKSEGKQGH